MAAKGEVAYVDRFRDCDVDASHGPAAFDAKTLLGPWAFLCSDCFDRIGVGLGVGRGQRLVLR